MKKPHKQHWYEKIRRDFLLSFFEPDNRYQEIVVNGFHLIKQFSKRLMDWEVAIYTTDSYQKRQKHKEKVKNLLVPRGNKQERV